MHIHIHVGCIGICLEMALLPLLIAVYLYAIGHVKLGLANWTFIRYLKAALKFEMMFTISRQRTCIIGQKDLTM